MFKVKSEKSSEFESWRETLLRILSELWELVSNQKLFTLGSIIERNYLTVKSHRDALKKRKEKKNCCSTNRTTHVDGTWIRWKQTQCCRNNRTKRGNLPGQYMGGFFFPFASSAFTSPILCLAECIVVLLAWRRAVGLAELLQKPGLKAWEKAAVWLD